MAYSTFERASPSWAYWWRLCEWQNMIGCPLTRPNRCVAPAIPAAA